MKDHKTLTTTLANSHHRHPHRLSVHVGPDRLTALKQAKFISLIGVCPTMLIDYAITCGEESAESRNAVLMNPRLLRHGAFVSGQAITGAPWHGSMRSKLARRAWGALFTLSERLCHIILYYISQAAMGLMVQDMQT